MHIQSTFKVWREINQLAYHGGDRALVAGRRVPESLSVESPAVPEVFEQLYPVVLTGGGDSVEKLSGDERVRVGDAAGGEVGPVEAVGSRMRHLGRRKCNKRAMALFNVRPQLRALEDKSGLRFEISDLNYLYIHLNIAYMICILLTAPEATTTSKQPLR